MALNPAPLSLTDMTTLPPSSNPLTSTITVTYPPTLLNLIALLMMLRITMPILVGSIDTIISVYIESVRMSFISLARAGMKCCCIQCFRKGNREVATGSMVNSPAEIFSKASSSLTTSRAAGRKIEGRKGEGGKEGEKGTYKWGCIGEEEEKEADVRDKTRQTGTMKGAEMVMRCNDKGFLPRSHCYAT